VDLALLPAMTDMRAQLARLVHRGFVAETGQPQLRHVPRYLAALRQRHERLVGGGVAAVNRDRALMDQVGPLQQSYLHRVEALPDGTPEPLALRRVRWMLEEYRVSLWAQQLGTPSAVSDARIRKALAAA
jgi:ATP-dependent helicase HrpA